MDLMTPVGRIVQGSVALQPQTDMETNKPLLNADGSPTMGVFLALAFPKVLPNGAPNTEFDAFRGQLAAVAAAAWPQFFPNGPSLVSVNPKFSWKIQDGDGVDSNGRSVADKPGFKGHWIVRLFTSYPFGCYNEGHFQAHEVLQKPEEVIKRGYWVRLAIEAKSNNADLSKLQVPGITLYPKLLSFVQRGEEIVGGPDAAKTFGAAPVGFVPEAPVGSPIPGPAAALPPPPAVAVPVPVAVPAVPVAVPLPPPAAVAPQYTPTALVVAGVTLDAMRAQGWTDELLVQHGYATKNY